MRRNSWADIAAKEVALQTAAIQLNTPPKTVTLRLPKFPASTVQELSRIHLYTNIYNEKGRFRTPMNRSSSHQTLPPK